jgi:hypothetical protein
VLYLSSDGCSIVVVTKLARIPVCTHRAWASQTRNRGGGNWQAAAQSSLEAVDGNEELAAVAKDLSSWFAWAMVICPRGAGTRRGSAPPPAAATTTTAAGAPSASSSRAPLAPALLIGGWRVERARHCTATTSSCWSPAHAVYFKCYDLGSTTRILEYNVARATREISLIRLTPELAASCAHGFGRCMVGWGSPPCICPDSACG